MLSRVAERLYWMARYKERAEDTARLTTAYTHLLMDLPEDAGMDWNMLVNVFDAEESFSRRYRTVSEQSVLKFLIADTDNPSSILASLISARENVRTTRDVLPSEVWEYTNELYLYATEFADKSVGRRNRYSFLDEVITRCQQINGLIMTSLSRHHAYSFITLGQLVERADMTTRVINVGANAILNRGEENPANDAVLWRSLLHSISAITSYRQYIGPVMEPNSAVDFSLKESSHPRSVIFCLRRIREELFSFHGNTLVIAEIDKAIEELGVFRMNINKPERLEKKMRNIQKRLRAINDIMTENWF